MPFPILAAAGLIGGGIKALFGGSQRRQGRRLMANNPYPEYKIPDEVFQNKDLASSMAVTGMPSEQYGLAQKNILRQQNTALSAANDRRAGLGLIGRIQRNTNDAQMGLDAQNAQTRIQNQRNLMNVNNQVAHYRDKAFDWNKKNRYLENRSYAMGLMGAGNQNIASGIDTALGGIVNQSMIDPSFGGLFGGGKRGMSAGAFGSPSYYNGYGPNSNYAEYETGY